MPHRAPVEPDCDGYRFFVLTREVGLSRAEAVTTGLAVVASSLAYALLGSPYLARGVVGDLVGFVVLAAVCLATRARLRHEALLCLAGIGLLLLVSPDWPLRVRDALWWPSFGVGLLGYLLLRRRVTRSARAGLLPQASDVPSP